LVESELYEDQIRGIEAIESGIEKLSQRWGPNADIMWCVPLINAYLKTNQVEAGLQLATAMINKAEQTKIFGPFGFGEILKLKAELLFARMGSSLDKEILQEVDELLQCALRKTEEEGLKLAHLKTLLVGVRIWEKTHNHVQLKEARQQLNTLSSFLIPLSKRHSFHLLKDALQLLEQLKLE
jgi:hypothetical protein